MVAQSKKRDYEYGIEISKEFIRIRRMMNGEHKIILKNTLKQSILT